jgi:hypothetical protein
VLSAGHTADELTLLDYNQEGTAMPEDGLFVSEAWLRADPKHRATTARFLRASFKGWAYCRDHADACVEIVLEHSAQGSTTRAAQRWQMDEVNKLIWGDPPDPATAIGYLPPELFERAAAPSGWGHHTPRATPGQAARGAPTPAPSWRTGGHPPPERAGRWEALQEGAPMPRRIIGSVRPRAAESSIATGARRSAACRGPA